MINQQKKISVGGLDLDNYNKFVAPEDYIFMLNCLNGTSAQHKGTVVQNTPGNRKVNFTLPSGNNQVVGFFEDKKSTSGIYLVKNDAGNHSVLRYHPSTGNIIPVCQEALLNFDKPIASINLVDDLFSWTTDDGNPPREFNIVRMQRQDENGVFKKVKFNLYFDFVNFRAGDTYNIQYGINNILVYSTAVDLTLEAGVADFVVQFNAAQTDFLASSCGTFVEVEASTAGVYDVSFTGINLNTGDPSLIQRVFTNIYPQTQDGFTFLETFINADKNPPICNPTITVKTDTSEKNNFIVSKIFQFQLAYTYVDNEKSSLSPFSVVSLGIGNYIEVNFTDSRLNDNNLTLIKGVQVYVKEGELGKLTFITELERWQFGIGNNFYKFFNNNAYNAVDDAYAVKLFESFPIEAGAQEVSDNRKDYGDITEGYDRVCVETSLTTSFTPPPELFTIKGIVVIRLLYPNPIIPDPTQVYTPVWNDNGTYFYGIEGRTIDQNIPLKGFVAYCAGTDFYGISKQKITGTQQDDSGAYFFTNDGFTAVANQNNVPYSPFKSNDPFGFGSDSRDQNGAYIGDKLFASTVHGSDVYSTFEINGLPKGRYIVRFAGNGTTVSQLSSTGYQKTSAYTIAVGNAASGVSPVTPQGFEYEIEVGANVISHDTTTAAQAGNIIYMGCSAMADLTLFTPFSNARTIITGYLCDSDLTAIPATFNDILEDTRIERALIRFSEPEFTPVFRFNTTLPNWSQLAWVGQRAVTDHNGFFWYVAFNLGGAKIDSVQTGVDSVILGQAFNTFNTPVTFSTNYTGYNRVALRNSNNTIKLNDRTYLKGRILDGTSPQESVPVVASLGSWQRTDEFGQFLIPYYVDTYYNVILAGGTSQRVGYAVYSSANNTIVYNFTSDQVFIGVFPVGITISSSSLYNNTDPSRWYILADMLADLLEQFLGVSGWKRGLAEDIGVIYFDRENRQTTVNDHIRKVYIPFYTENNTIGSAAISWVITSLPPDSATHYQWVRTHSTPNFLQFNITDITYVDAGDNLTSFVNAAFIKIQLNSLLDYHERYPNTSIGYTFQRGDMMRPISNGSGNLYSPYLNTEIVKDATQSANYYIYVEKNNIFLTLDVGSLIEIYTPKPASNTVFYEFGECYEIYELDGVKYHRGSTQNQTSTQPATGTFKSGNVYYRFRNFVLGGAKYIEDSSVSDFYESLVTQTGRPQILDKNAKQVRRPTLIRFSNQYFSGSATNGFASFEALNQKELDRVFGEIRILSLMSESVLLCICQHKTQTFYVKKATLNVPSTAPNLVSLSDEVLSVADTLIGEWGISDKATYDRYTNYSWWFDATKGAIIRYSTNGLETPSRYKMQAYFADKGRLQLFARGGYDPYHNLYNISIGDETVAFNDGVNGGKDRWTSFYSYLPECYGKIGTQLLSFLNGEIWVHDSSVKNNFYGVQYDSQIQVTANDAPSEVKSWQAIALESTDGWDTELTIQPNVTRPLGQRTVVSKNLFIKKEGMLYREFQRDMNTVNMPSVDESLVNGDKMRGEVAEVKLINDNTGEVQMFALDLITIYSPLSNNIRK